MANTLISESLCTSNTQWKVYWTKGIGKIKFHDTDAASDYYRAYTGNQLQGSYNKLMELKTKNPENLGMIVPKS